MTKNPSFINEVASQFGKDDEIIIVRPCARNHIILHFSLELSSLFGADVSSSMHDYTGVPEREKVIHGCSWSLITCRYILKSSI